MKIQITQQQHVGIITLNRPEALNALNEKMLIEIAYALNRFAQNNSIQAVMIRSSSDRAFCAGGDVKNIQQLGPVFLEELMQFFHIEYNTNYQIYNYAKPFIAFMNGITYGGGLGISIHGTYRVASDDLMLAMPESKIGFAPDVGTLHVLARLPNYLGYYLALTGNAINAQDALNVGLVDTIVQKAAFPQIQRDYIESLNIKAVCQEQLTSITPSLDEETTQRIATHFSQPTIIAILNALQSDSHPFCQNTYQALLERSPTSLFVIHEALNRAKQLSFEDSLQMEYDLVYHFLQQHDFFEGVRAMIVDKDKNPQWQPASIADVSPQTISHYFTKQAYGNLLNKGVRP